MNKDLIEPFTILSKYYNQINDKFRKQSYEKAILSIKSYTSKIVNIKQVSKMEGIGKSIKAKIKEFLDTGEIRKAEEFRVKLNTVSKKSKEDEAKYKFMKVWGIGKVKADLLWKKGIKSMDELRKRQDLLTAQQRIGIKYYKDIQRRISRKYIDIIQMSIRYALSTEFGMNSYTMQIAGSYRRQEKESGDVDCLITSTKFTLKDMINVLIKSDIVTDVLSMKNEKFMGIAQCPSGEWFNVRLDVEFLPIEEYGSGLLYFTGSKAMNIHMRKKALKLGLTLNQHGLFKGSERLPFYTEKEIFTALEIKYVSPEKR
jgi:DNA polymerase/3'-5' exonuclease PolX